MFFNNADVFSIFLCFSYVQSEIIVTSTESDFDKYVNIRTENVIKDNGNSIVEATTYKYPTATWSAPNYDMKKKSFSELSKLYLFKPSPFLKPPFTEGDVGVAITGIDDGVDVSGHRRGSWKKQQRKKHHSTTSTTTTPVPVETTTMTKKYSDVLDTFLEESLTNYIRSRNLTDEFGTISVEMFSEALRRITEEKRFTLPPYDKNIELRKKFREELLSPKKMEVTTPSSILEKQYQRRLKKTWEVINENISVPSRTAVLENREDWSPIDLTTETTTSSTFRSETPRTKIDVTTENINSWTTTTIPDFILPSVTTRSEVSFTTTSIPRESKIRSKTYRGKKKWRDSVRKMKAENNLDDGELKLSVAETVYFRPRETPLQSFTYQYEPDFNSIPGQPEKDYPMLSSPPATGFRCPNLNGKGPKMMADRKARCQVFYICTGDGPAAPMLCPNGTMFNENVLVCDWWYNVDC